MAVKVRQRGGSWWLFVDFKGRRKAKRVGGGKEGRRAALAAAEQIQAKLALGDLSPLEDRKPEPVAPPPPLFREYAKHWLALRAHRWKPSTREQYDTQLRCRLLPAFGDLPVSSITRAGVEAFISQHLQGGNRRHQGQGLNPITMRTNLTVLGAMLKTAVRDGWLTENPATETGDLFPTRARQGQRDIEVFTREELMALLETAECDWPDSHPLVLTLARTGVRLGEALALQWSDIDLAHRTILVRRTWRRAQLSTPKNGKTRRVDTSPQLRQVLQGWQTLQAAEAALRGQELSVWVFPDPTGHRPIWPETFRAHVWRPLLQRADLRYRPPHTLRHTYASQLLQAGAPVPYVAEQLGHYSPVLTLNTYSHVIPQANVGVVDRLDDATIRNPRATSTLQPIASH